MSGKDPVPNAQAYEGVRATNPPTVVKATRDPVNGQDKKYPIGTIWVNTSTNTVFILSSASGGTNTWQPLSNNSGAASGTTATFTTLVVNGSGGPSITAGTGAPSATAPKGSLYIRLDGSSTSTRMYINTDGATTWTNFVTAA